MIHVPFGVANDRVIDWSLGLSESVIICVSIRKEAAVMKNAARS